MICSTNQAKEGVEGAGRRGHAHEAAPEDDEHGGRAEAGEREEAPRRAAPPLPERLEHEARGADAGPGHGRPVAVDEEGEAVPAAARRRVRPGDDVLLGQDPRPSLVPEPQIRHGNRERSARLVNSGTAGPPFPQIGTEPRWNRSPSVARTNFPPNQSSKLEEEGRTPQPSSRTHKEPPPPAPRKTSGSSPELYDATAAEEVQSGAALRPRNDEKSPVDKEGKAPRGLGGRRQLSWGGWIFRR